MDEVDLVLIGALGQPERLTHPVLEGAFDLAGTVDVVIRVTLYGFHFGEVLFVGESRVDSRGG